MRFFAPLIVAMVALSTESTAIRVENNPLVDGIQRLQGMVQNGAKAVTQMFEGNSGHSHGHGHGSHAQSHSHSHSGSHDDEDEKDSHHVSSKSQKSSSSHSSHGDSDDDEE